MSNKDRFEAAKAEVEKKDGEFAANFAKMNNDQKLVLYGLFKQATVGDVNTDRPGMLDFTGKSKWDAWEKNKGLSAEEAMAKYADAVEEYKKL